MLSSRCCHEPCDPEAEEGCWLHIPCTSEAPHCTAWPCTVDFTGHHCIKGIMKDIVHKSGPGVPLAKVVFRDAYQFSKRMELFTAARHIQLDRGNVRGGLGAPCQRAPLCVAWRRSLATKASCPASQEMMPGRETQQPNLR